MPAQDGRRHIVDVLRDHFGGEDNFRSDLVYAQSDRQIALLIEAINMHFDGWRPPLDDHLIRAYGGSFAGSDLRPGNAREAMLTQLLYMDALLIIDPLARYFDPYAGASPLPPPALNREGEPVTSLARLMVGRYGHFSNDHDLEWTRLSLAELVPLYRPLAPLYDSGALIDVPADRLRRARSAEILDAVNEDIGDVEMARTLSMRTMKGPGPVLIHNLRGPVLPHDELEASLKAGVLAPIVQDASYMLNSDLVIAGSGLAQYVPRYPVDYALLDTRWRRLGTEFSATESATLRVLPALKVGVLPRIGKLDIETVLDARAQEPAFESWRSALRTVVRSVPQAVTDTTFEDEIALAVKDYLDPAIDEIDQALKKSAVLNRARDSLAEAALSGALLGGAGAALGLAGAAVGAAIGAAGSVSGKLLRETFLPTGPTGDRAVIVRLIQR
jgi:hypothetical protein